MTWYMWLGIGLILGATIGTYFFVKVSTMGVLKIDTHSNPEKDIYRIELDTFDYLTKKKRVVLRIDTDANLSQE